MSIKLMSLVWDSELPTDEKFVALALADFADDDGNRIYPSVSTIARKVGKSERQVQRTLSKLKRSRLLTPVSGEAGGRGNTVHYHMDVNRLGGKGVNMSPFTEPESVERVTYATQRVTPTSPDPSRTTSSGSGSDPEGESVSFAGKPRTPRGEGGSVYKPRSRFDTPPMQSPGTVSQRRPRSRL